MKQPVSRLEQVRRWVHNRPYNDAERLYRQGFMPDRVWEGYCFAWEWSAPRMSSHAQEAVYKKHGVRELLRRINRVRRIMGFHPYEIWDLDPT